MLKKESEYNHFTTHITGYLYIPICIITISFPHYATCRSDLGVAKNLRCFITQGLTGNWTLDLLHESSSLRLHALRRNHTTRPSGRWIPTLTDYCIVKAPKHVWFRIKTPESWNSELFIWDRIVGTNFQLQLGLVMVQYQKESCISCSMSKLSYDTRRYARNSMCTITMRCMKSNERIKK